MGLTETSLLKVAGPRHGYSKVRHSPSPVTALLHGGAVLDRVGRMQQHLVADC